MSDSGLSSVDIAMDVEYEQSLKRAVRNGLAAKEQVTVNAARERAERELGLDVGFFKRDAVWKGKSKDIVQAAYDEPQSSPEKPKPTAKLVVAKAKSGTKRKSNDVLPPCNKRSKKAAITVTDSDALELSDSEVDAAKDEEDASEFGESDRDEKRKAAAKKVGGKAAFPKAQAKIAVTRKPANKKAKDESISGSEAEAEVKTGPKARNKKAPPTKKSQDVVESDSEGENGGVAASKTTKAESELSEAPGSKDDPLSKPPTEEDDESDMSVLIEDSPPKKKKKRAANGPSKAKATKSSNPAATKKKGPDLTPNQEEIKKLQGWLVKCGVRKMWHNELKNCDTEKEKIRHLKKMLEDVGMTGRYSNEKAKDIFEARELAKELEEAQQYAAKWGTKDDKDDGSGSEAESGADEAASKTAAAVPRRPKGFVDFGDSGDESG